MGHKDVTVMIIPTIINWKICTGARLSRMFKMRLGLVGIIRLLKLRRPIADRVMNIPQGILILGQAPVIVIAELVIADRQKTPIVVRWVTISK